MSKIDLNSLPVVEKSPLQPTNIRFPQRLFGKKNPKKRSFQQAWYKSYPWLQYNSPKGVCYCHTCVKALQETKIKPNGNIELAFTSKGFYNWKDAKVAFRNHEDSAVHRKSVEMLYTLPRTTKDIGETLSESYANEKKKNREYLLKILQNVRFLARQLLAIRDDGSEENSNFVQLLRLRAEDDDAFVKEIINKKTDEYTSADIQNEMLR